jgi:hypothetical protein
MLIPTLLLPCLWAIILATANIAVALLAARWAQRSSTIELFFRWVVGGLVVRTLGTLGLFAWIFLRFQSDRASQFVFALVFVLCYALLLGVEVWLLHCWQLSNKSPHAEYISHHGT